MNSPMQSHFARHRQLTLPMAFSYNRMKVVHHEKEHDVAVCCLDWAMTNVDDASMISNIVKRWWTTTYFVDNVQVELSIVSMTMT
jgi:hypothetical protein